MGISTDEISNASILGFIVRNEIVTEKGEPLDFYDRPFLLDILTDWNPRIVVKKCAQIGGSLTFNIKILFAIKTFQWNAIYTFPTDGDVNEFVSSKTNPLIKANISAFPVLDTDNIQRKEIQGRFLFFKGTVSKTAAIMTSADVLIHDEADRSDQKALADYKSRTKASTYKGRWIFSNPTTEKGEVDLEWLKSDQKEWYVTCRSCKLEQSLHWPINIDMVKKIFICSKCRAELTDDDRRFGKWIATNPGAKGSGYHISLLMAAWITAEEIIEDSEGDQEYFYNFVLGEPYNPGDLRINRGTILDCWTPKNIETGNWYLGVDVGNEKHYVLGSEKGVIKIGKFAKWEELDDILKFYDPVFVIDAMPDNTMSKFYMENYPRGFMCYLNRDKKAKRMVRWGEKKDHGVIFADRNRLIDKVLIDIVEAKFLFNIQADRYFKDYLKHFETMRRVKEVDTLGVERFVWESTTGQDHYCFATFFYWLAVLASGTGVVIGQTSKKTELVKETSEGPISNLKEILEEREDEFL